MKKLLIVITVFVLTGCIVAPMGEGCVGDYNCDCGCGAPPIKSVYIGDDRLCGTYMILQPKIECNMTVIDRPRSWCSHCN